MSIQIVGEVDRSRLFCAGSFTKLLTTYVSLSLLSEKYDLTKILDDDDFFDQLCINAETKAWLALFQKTVGAKFSLHDICSYYAGLPYTFDVSEEELEWVDAGYPFKHHCIPDEKQLWHRCKHHITPIYKPKSKFHYSELSIIFLGFFLEKAYDCLMEDLYQTYLISKFNLKNSLFSRTFPPQVYCQDLSDKYDYPSIAVLDHGYFCYSNGFFSTLEDMKILLENLLEQPIFHFMTDLKNARAASMTIMNGLSVELRVVEDDILYGYEGLSFSGCNIWAYSTKNTKGYLTFTNDEEAAYEIYELLGYSSFEKAPEYAHQIYKQFKNHYPYQTENRNIPEDFQGRYHRVIINKKNLETVFLAKNKFIIIRDPEEVQYDLIYVNDNFHIKGKDNTHGAKVGFVTSKQGNKYMYHDGTLYRKI